MADIDDDEAEIAALLAVDDDNGTLFGDDQVRVAMSHIHSLTHTHAQTHRHTPLLFHHSLPQRIVHLSAHTMATSNA
jgi:hypothetical protein